MVVIIVDIIDILVILLSFLSFIISLFVIKPKRLDIKYRDFHLKLDGNKKDEDNKKED